MASDFQVNPIDGTSTRASSWQRAFQPRNRNCLPGSPITTRSARSLYRRPPRKAGVPLEHGEFMAFAHAAAAEEIDGRYRASSTSPSRCPPPAGASASCRRICRVVDATSPTAEVHAGRCSCETTNPSGTCCLGEVNRGVNLEHEVVWTGGQERPQLDRP